MPEPDKQKSKGKRLAGLGEDDDDPLATDELGRDPQDMERERKKTAEEVRMEEELAAEVGRFHLKRTLSTTSLKSEQQPTTPPPTEQVPNIFSPSQISRQMSQPDKEPETPAKKRKGSSDADVKSPSVPSRGLSFGIGLSGGTEGISFGGSLGGPLVTMEEEEEL